MQPWTQELTALRTRTREGQHGELLDDTGNLNALGQVLLGGNDAETNPALQISVRRFPGMYPDRKRLREPATTLYIPPLLRPLAMLIDELGPSFSPTLNPWHVDAARFVFRELLVNAVAHRDYALPHPIRVDRYTDALVIASPGLPVGASLNGTSFTGHGARNPPLLDHLRRLTWCAGRGTGWARACAQAREIGLNLEAQVTDHDTVVHVSMDAERQAALELQVTRSSDHRRPVSEWESRVREALEDGKWHRPKDLRTSLGIPSSTLTRVLKALEDHGMVERSAVNRRAPNQSWRRRPDDA